MLYRALFWLVLKRLPAETAHHVGFALLRATMSIPGVAALCRRLLGARDPALRITVFGRSPINFLIALLVPALARSSRNLPSRMKVMTTAAASK